VLVLSVAMNLVSALAVWLAAASLDIRLAGTRDWSCWW